MTYHSTPNTIVVDRKTLNETVTDRKLRKPARRVHGDFLDPQYERAIERVVRSILRRRNEQGARNRVWAMADSLVRHSSTLQYDRERLVSHVARRIARELDKQSGS